MPDTLREPKDVAHAALAEVGGDNGRSSSSGMSQKTAVLVASLAQQVQGIAEFQKTLANTLESFIRESGAKHESLLKTIAEKGATRWQTIWSGLAVLIATLGALGTLAYLPVKSGMEENARALNQFRSDVQTMFAGVVPRAEHERVWAMWEERFATLTKQDDIVRTQLVPRKEWELMNSVVQQRLEIHVQRLGKLEQMIDSRNQDDLREAREQIRSLREELARFRHDNPTTAAPSK